MTSTAPIAVHGAGGRMGQAILRLAYEEAHVPVAAAIVRGDSPLLGISLGERFGAAAGELAYGASLDESAPLRVLLDFSSADAFDGALAAATSRRIAFVSGTTGLAPRQFAELERAAATIPVLWSANFSVGVAVLTSLVRTAAAALARWDCEIVESHHRHKIDAPSGTALALGRAVAQARGDDFEQAAERDPARRTAPRDARAIGFAFTRAGDVVGEHTVMFAGSGERIELVHRARDRDIFARGALRAAQWSASQPPGLYNFADALDLPGT
jgi:4-hydroxy-tetrahydrodipicolinate reductase